MVLACKIQTVIFLFKKLHFMSARCDRIAQGKNKTVSKRQESIPVGCVPNAP